MKKIFLTLTIMSLLCFSQQSFSNETTTEITISSLTEQANQGNANAQFNLGVMYSKGQGVPQDTPKAKSLFKQGCLNKNQTSCNEYSKLNR